MPRQTEPRANNSLGQLLRCMLSGSEMHSENIRVIEAEYLPAANVEGEAQERLGLPLTVHPRPIEAAIDGRSLSQ